MTEFERLTKEKDMLTEFRNTVANMLDDRHKREIKKLEKLMDEDKEMIKKLEKEIEEKKIILKSYN